MTVPRTVAEVLGNHVKLEVECIDRMYLNVYVPQLQTERGVACFFKFHRGYTFASSAVMQPVTNAFLASIDGFIKKNELPLIEFKKGQRKDDVAQEHLARFKGDEGVLFVGKAQEKARVIRTERRYHEGKPYAWLVRSTAMVNHFYFYCVDRDFGPFFLKFCTYFPYNAKLCINGHEYVKRQLAAKGIAFEALDNGILSCAEPKRLQAICDGLSAEKIDGLLRKWLRRFPHPYLPCDRLAGYRYDLSIIQAEFSLTEGVVPSLHVDYKKSRIKQYFKEGRALRTETTINDAHDFGIGRRIKNLPALRKVGFEANRRLLNVQRVSHDCAIGEDAFNQVQQPTDVCGQRASALRFADTRVQALFSALVLFQLLPRGFTNRELREHLAPLLGIKTSDLTEGRMTYDLRRLRLHGIIERIPKSHRYRVTAFGLRTALFYTRTYARIIRPGLALIHDDQLPAPQALRRSFDQLEEEMNRWCEQAKVAA